MFQTKVVEKIKTNILCYITFFSENGGVYEIMLKNAVQLGRPYMKIRCKCIACWLPKSTNIYSEYVILIDFPLQQ